MIVDLKALLAFSLEFFPPLFLCVLCGFVCAKYLVNCFAHNMLPSGIYTIISWARISLRSPSGCLLTFNCGERMQKGMAY